MLELQDIYHASMLTLFTPWRNIAHLKGTSETFKQAFDTFMKMVDKQTINMMANIQYQYECSNSAIKKRVEENVNAGIVGMSIDEEDLDHPQHIGKSVRNGENDDAALINFTQNDVKHKIASEFSQDD